MITQSCSTLHCSTEQLHTRLYRRPQPCNGWSGECVQDPSGGNY
ncbi:hypothetical protein Nmel_014276 [Mimus melanotis]